MDRNRMHRRENETFAHLFLRSSVRRDNFSAARKFFDDAKIYNIRLVAIDSVQKSSKSELSSRFFGRLKFAETEILVYGITETALKSFRAS